MFGRKKQEEATVTPAPVVEQRPGAKNRPTPSRREAEAARRRPIVPADREAAKKDSRRREREERAKYREAMYRGEEWALGPRDRGPQRRFVRDMVDSRWNVGEFLLPLMIIALPISMLPYRWAYIAGFTVLYGMIALTVLDVLLLTRRVKKAVREKFGEEPAKGTAWYVFSRSVQLRAGRMPRPQVTRGGRAKA
ncbi:DUF3043 domain-containing protein [Mobilicoccus massiliensis]|uniref:DUF3043 domain-containing protein n=1 Tax=Mobilicoccus massiliensis TaxID=1522310 RepID=UPI00058E7AE1|nr:DUF3043 domain-containing protein [Mobilicoccus massiliensis]